MPTYSNIRGTDADESVAVSTSNAVLTEPSYASETGASPIRAVCQVRTAAILFTTNGTAPTAADESTGTKVNVGDFVTFYGRQEINNVIMKRFTGTDGAIFVRYEKRVD